MSKEREDAVYAQGKQDERAEIVAFLRTWASAISGTIQSRALEDAADLIEAGKAVG